MKILITGNMGYIGPMLGRHLRSIWPTAELIGFDAGYFAHCLTCAPVLPESRLNAQYFGDVRHFPAELLKGVDAVVQLAAISNDPMGKEFERVTHEVNQVATTEIAKMAKAAGVKSMVFASSCSVYGSAENTPRTEESDLDPLSAYARSKVGSEEALRRLGDENFQVTCLRFATACGMSDRLRLDLVLNDFVQSATTADSLQILSDGTPWRPLIHIGDMSRAIEWAIGRETENGGNSLVINAGSRAWNYQVKELAEAVAVVMPGTKIQINSNAAPDKRSYRVDFSLYEKLAPAHQPKWTLHETIADLKKGCAALPPTSQFKRLTTLKELHQTGLLDSSLRFV